VALRSPSLALVMGAPRNHGGSAAISNLQAFCFRDMQASYGQREAGCLFCALKGSGQVLLEKELALCIAPPGQMAMSAEMSKCPSILDFQELKRTRVPQPQTLTDRLQLYPGEMRVDSVELPEVRQGISSKLRCWQAIIEFFMGTRISLNG